MPFDRDEKIVRWCISALLAVFAFINGFQFASLILLLVAVIAMPIKPITDFMLNLKPMVAVIVSLALITVGVMTMPEQKITSGGKNNYPVVDNRPVVDNSGSSTNDFENSDGGNSDQAGDTDKVEGSDTETTPDMTPTPDPDSGTEDNKEDEPAQNPSQSYDGDYILNTSTKKFHKSTCYMVKRIDDKNRESYSGSRSSLINDGYEPCGHCDP